MGYLLVHYRLAVEHMSGNDVETGHPGAGRAAGPGTGTENGTGSEYPKAGVIDSSALH